jgi:hypothetical protein
MNEERIAKDLEGVGGEERPMIGSDLKQVSELD